MSDKTSDRWKVCQTSALDRAAAADSLSLDARTTPTRAPTPALSAALILFLAFMSLASSPGTDVKVLATGLAAGILLDATVIRALLVPATVALFGRWNWWLPDWLAKLLRVEPSHPHAEPRRS